MLPLSVQRFFVSLYLSRVVALTVALTLLGVAFRIIRDAYAGGTIHASDFMLAACCSFLAVVASGFAYSITDSQMIEVGEDEGESHE